MALRTFGTTTMMEPALERTAFALNMSSGFLSLKDIKQEMECFVVFSHSLPLTCKKYVV